MRVIFVNRYFWPDHSATAQILGDLAFALAQRGFDVEIVTSRLSYSDASARYPAREERGGVIVHRVATSGFGRAGLLGRAADYLSFYIAAALKVLTLLRRGDVLVAKTDPPLLSVILSPIARFRGAKLVNWLQDIYPELADALGVRFAGGPAGRVMRALRDRSLRKAAANVVLGERMRGRLADRGIAPGKIAIIPNFADDEAVRPLPYATGDLRTEWGFAAEELVVGYSGNLGRAHDLETIMQAAKLLQKADDGQIRFLFIGGGALFDTIGEATRRHELSNVSVRPYQPREMLRESLAVPDIHLISLRGELEGYILPSKYYGILAAGRGMIFLGAEDGDIAVEIEREGLGASLRIGDALGLANYLRSIHIDRARLLEHGRLARSVMEGKYLRNHGFERWEQLLRSLSV